MQRQDCRSTALHVFSEARSLTSKPSSRFGPPKHPERGRARSNVLGRVTSGVADCGEVKLLLDRFPRNKRALGTGSVATASLLPQPYRCCQSRVRTAANGTTGCVGEYGLTPEDVDRMFAEQGGLCAICREAPAVQHVDHDHATNRVRGLLCFNCNGALGQFRDRRRPDAAGGDVPRGRRPGDVRRHPAGFSVGSGATGSSTEPAARTERTRRAGLTDARPIDAAPG